MTSPPAASPFAQYTPADVRQLIEDYPLAWVVSGDGAQAGQLPLVGVFDSLDRLTGLIGHFPAAHPLGAALQHTPRATLLFTGPQGYVSPTHAGRRDWGPTWNFAHVQVRADITVEPAFTAEAVDILVEQMERPFAQPWQAHELGARYAAMLPRIIGFRAQVTALEARFKLGQDERVDTLQHILAALPSAKLLRWMRRMNSHRLPCASDAKG